MSTGGASGSIRRRLLLGVLGAVTLLWLLSALFTWREAEHELDELLDAHLTQAAALLVAQQAHSGEPDDDGLMDPAPLHHYTQRVAFQVFHQGVLTLRSPHAPEAAMSSRLEGFETRSFDGATWRLFATRGAEADVQVYVAEQLASRAEILRAMLWGLLGPMLFTLPLIALAAWGVISASLRPLRELSTQLAQRHPGELAPLTLPGPEPSEMQPVMLALNGLLSRVGQLIESERRFTADAAHELRTPIAAIRTQAQVAGGARDEAERRHALQATLQGCDRATHLVQQLLTLSRLEASAPQQGPSQRQPCDLSALAQSVAADLAPGALARQQELSLQADPGCCVAGDDTLLRALLRNLVDNALRYSPPGAEVAITVQASATGVRLTVDDSGPGLAADDLARLGERFYRPPGQAASGSGLGWSIVQRIAQAHGAQVQAHQPSRLGGLSVQVIWPACPQADAAA
jgi:two-component system sensor histidine kinase QseC